MIVGVGWLAPQKPDFSACDARNLIKGMFSVVYLFFTVLSSSAPLSPMIMMFLPDGYHIHLLKRK